MTQSLVGIVIIKDGKFSYSNTKFDAIFGYSAEEVRDWGHSISQPRMIDHSSPRISADGSAARRGGWSMYSVGYARMAQ